MGITDEQLRGLPDHGSSPAFSEVERLVLRYTDAMTRTPVEVPDGLFVALRARFDEAQVIELSSAIAWENYRARFDHALGVESEGFSEGAFCPLPAQGGRTAGPRSEAAAAP